MQLNDITAERLRELSDVRPAEGRVITVVLDLDPREFATGPARASAIRSILDEAQRRIEGADDLTHAEQRWLRQDLARVERFLTQELDATGAHALALVASTPANLFEVLRLPHAVPSAVVVDRTPHLGPLVRQAPSDRWAVLVLSRGASRILTGTTDRLKEVSAVDTDIRGQHRQGGRSQTQFARSIEEEVADNVRQSAARLRRQFRSRPFDHLVVAAHDEVWALIEAELDDAPRSRLAGRLAIDLQRASPDEILVAARPLMTDAEVAHEAERLERLQEGLAKDTIAVVGEEAIADMLEQQRVETLLVAEDFDDTTFLERATEAALQQSAEVLFVRHHDTLGEVGGIGAVLRF